MSSSKQHSHHVDFDNVVEKYMVCAPQLLHFDEAGNPLWLNGWLAADKYSKDIDVGVFEVFVKEPEGKKDEAEFWDLKDANVCCLTAASYEKVSAEDKRTLEMMASLAMKVERDLY